MDIEALKRDLDGLKIEDNPKIVQQKSRDFYWYSPVLKRQLEHVTADLVVSPKSEAEVIRVLAACHRHSVPVTPRGAGTGNYGQAMPLSGGVILSLAEMNAVIPWTELKALIEPHYPKWTGRGRPPKRAPASRPVSLQPSARRRPASRTPASNRDRARRPTSETKRLGSTCCEPCERTV